MDRKKMAAIGIIASIPIGLVVAILVISGLKVFLQVAAAFSVIIAIAIPVTWAATTLSED